MLIKLNRTHKNIIFIDTYTYIDKYCNLLVTFQTFNIYIYYIWHILVSIIIIEKQSGKRTLQKWFVVSNIICLVIRNRCCDRCLGNNLIKLNIDLERSIYLFFLNICSRWVSNRKRQLGNWIVSGLTIQCCFPNLSKLDTPKKDVPNTLDNFFSALSVICIGTNWYKLQLIY